MELIDKIKSISKRQIALKSGVHMNTITKYFNGEPILLIKEQQIKEAAAEILRDRQKINKELQAL